MVRGTVQIRITLALITVLTLGVATAASARPAFMGLDTPVGRSDCIATAISGDGCGNRCEPDWDPCGGAGIGDFTCG